MRAHSKDTVLNGVCSDLAVETVRATFSSPESMLEVYGVPDKTPEGWVEFVHEPKAEEWTPVSMTLDELLTPRELWPDPEKDDIDSIEMRLLKAGKRMHIPSWADKRVTHACFDLLFDLIDKSQSREELAAVYGEELVSEMVGVESNPFEMKMNEMRQNEIKRLRAEYDIDLQWISQNASCNLLDLLEEREKKYWSDREEIDKKYALDGLI